MQVTLALLCFALICCSCGDGYTDNERENVMFCDTVQIGSRYNLPMGEYRTQVEAWNVDKDRFKKMRLSRWGLRLAMPSVFITTKNDTVVSIWSRP